MNGAGFVGAVHVGAVLSSSQTCLATTRRRANVELPIFIAARCSFRRTPVSLFRAWSAGTAVETDPLTLFPASNDAGTPLTMSSREIAELCEARHNDVVATIDRLFATGVLRESRKTLRSYAPPSGGRPTEVYDLTKRDTLVVVSGYRDDVRARIIDRWMELEGIAPAPKVVLDFSDPQVMLGVFEHLKGQVEQKDKIIVEQGHRLEKLDRLEGAEGSVCISTAAKVLGVDRIKDLFAFMSARRWIFKRAGSKGWLAYDDKRKAGYLEHDDHPFIDEQGRERVSTRVLVTPKGRVKLAELLNEPLQ